MSDAQHKWWLWLGGGIRSGVIAFLAQLYFGAYYDAGA
jgi:hypothetical protein